MSEHDSLDDPPGAEPEAHTPDPSDYPSDAEPAQQEAPQVVLVPLLEDALTEAQVQDLKDLVARTDVSDLQAFISSDLVQNLSTVDERILRLANSRAEAAGDAAAAAKADLEQGPVQIVRIPGHP